MNFVETGEILRSGRLICQNGYKMSIIVIQLAKSKFSTTASSKKASQATGNSKMAAKTGNIYIWGTMTDSVEIPTANLEFSTMASSKAVFVTDFDNDRQPEVATRTYKVHTTATRSCSRR